MPLYSTYHTPIYPNLTHVYDLFLVISFLLHNVLILYKFSLVLYFIQYSIY